MKRLGEVLADCEWALSHNDLHLGNILVESPEKVVVLDFEFSQFNYLGYDLGNFLNEWATLYQ
jgi:thiamine kinase-like enzyme